MPNSRVA